MSKFKRSDDWGFPRWRDYGIQTEAVKVRMCDHFGCTEAGTHPAPKAPNSPEKWMFCVAHATEYNKNWDYFAGLTPEEAFARAQAEEKMNSYARSQHWQWSEDGDERHTAVDRGAFKTLGLELSASEAEMKAAYRALAKQYHPDRNPNDAEAAKKFHAVTVAYETLSLWFALQPKQPGA